MFSGLRFLVTGKLFDQSTLNSAPAEKLFAINEIQEI